MNFLFHIVGVHTDWLTFSHIEPLGHLIFTEIIELVRHVA